MPAQQDVNEMMAGYAKVAVDCASNSFGVRLDYSVESIERLEHLLSQLYSKLPRGFFQKLLQRGLTHGEVEKASEMFGAYIGEVIRRHGGGTWEMDTRFTRGHICLRKDEKRIYPASKVYKRLTQGPSDSVWFYVQYLMQEGWSG